MKRRPILMTALCLAGCPVVWPKQVPGIVSHPVVIRHPGIADGEPQSYELSQMLDRDGHPVGYAMAVDSVVCTDGLCKVVKVTMNWDALGTYQCYALAGGTVLEKAQVDDAAASSGQRAWAAFTQADHEKLHRILRDRNSVLRTQRLSDLTGYRDKSRIDGVTGATPLAVRDAVVEGAALSSYHLWHWANGEVVGSARELTHMRCSESLLQRFLSRDESQYVLFALEHLRLHNLFRPSLVSAVIKVMGTGDHDRIDLGLAYLRSAIPDRDAFHDKVADVFVESDSRGRIYLLGCLDDEKEISGTHLDKMSMCLKDTDTYYELHLFLSLLEKRRHVSEQVLGLASHLLASGNFFVARRAFQYLETQPLDESMTLCFKAFQEKCERENRNLY